MKRIGRAGLVVASCLSLVLACAGCSDGVEGRWEGTVTERGKTTRVGLSLSRDGGELAGKLTILSDTGQDVTKGHAFDLVDVAEDGDALTFVLPIGGTDDPDNVIFTLRLEGDTLAGSLREKRDNTRESPVTFTRTD